MAKLVLIRHGESLWNKENRFTGWKDVDLSEQGFKEAKKAADTLKAAHLSFDYAYSSVLKRAMKTLAIILDDLNLQWIPTTRSWRLNERHYGDLQGLNKSETAAKYGEEQVFIWRRSYDILPPLMDKNNPDHPIHDIRYKQIDPRTLPGGESLKTTVERVIPFWVDSIAPRVIAEKNIIIGAHGNSIRALIKYLDNISDTDIATVNIPTGVPLVYEFGKNLEIIKSYYLGDESEIEKAKSAVANQGKSH